MIEISVPRCDGREPALDELKGAAIFGVILYHAGGTLVWRNLVHGDLGVDAFFVISGLTLAMSNSRLGFWQFAKRRFLRIFPAYWVALSLFLTLNIVLLKIPYVWGDLASHALGVHALFGDKWLFSVNPSFWFISPLLVYYLLFFFLRPLLDRLDQFIFASFVLAAVTSLTPFWLGQSGLMGHWGFRGWAFFIGAVAGRALRDGQIKIPFTPWLGIGVFLGLFVPYYFSITPLSTLIGVALMLAYAAGARPLLAERKGGRLIQAALAFMGVHSLEIFLLHQPLIKDYVYYGLARACGPAPYSAGVVIMAMVLGLAITLILAVTLRKVLARLLPSGN